MKKSDMEKKIATVLNNLEKVKMSNMLKAQAILVELETSGMLPPEIRRMVRNWDYEGPEYVNEWDGE